MSSSSYVPPTLNQTPPPWLRDDTIIQEDVQPLNSNNEQSEHSGSHKILRRSALIHNFLRVTTILLCILMAATAVIGIGKCLMIVVFSDFLCCVEYINDVDTSGKFFVSTYMLFFSILLLVFEVNEIKKFETIEHLYRRNFGFIYSVLGKAFFIIL
jgi:hypothetical protein